MEALILQTVSKQIPYLLFFCDIMISESNPFYLISPDQSNAFATESVEGGNHAR